LNHEDRLLDVGWGLVPKPLEFHALGRKMESKGRDRSGRPVLDQSSPPFLCPAQALGLALQHHPILLAGKCIVVSKTIMSGKETIIRDDAPLDKAYFDIQ